MARHTAQLTIALVIIAGVGVEAADLHERTLRAYEEYAERATRLFVERVRTSTPGTDGAASLREPARRNGVVLARLSRENGILSVPDGLIHHWAGSTFIEGATLQDALDVSYDYGHYDAIYKPVIASTLLGRDGSTYRVLVRIKGSGGGLSAILDVTSHVQYFYPDSRRAYSISTSDEIREIKHAGTVDERSLPPGHDSGYLWRVATFTSFVAEEGGVFTETETLGLSRSFPPFLGWFIEPIARRLGRQSIEQSLQDFSRAVRARLRERQGTTVRPAD